MSEAPVSLDTVIQVLRANKVEVSRILNPDGSLPQPPMFALAKGDSATADYIFEVVTIELPVKRRLLSYLARKWQVPIHHFYNPLMARPCQANAFSRRNALAPVTASLPLCFLLS